MKFWPGGIIIAIVVFILGMVSVMYIFLSQDLFLVVDDYYEAEVAYQDRINSTRNSMDLEDGVKIAYIAGDQTLALRFPESFEPSMTTGKIHFYRPSNATQDVHIDLTLDTIRQQVIKIDRLEKGFWRLKLDWQNRGTKYFKEETFFIE